MTTTYVANIEAYLKEKYPQKRIQNVVNTAVVLKDIIEQDKRNVLGGRDDYVPIRVGLEGGVAFIAEGGEVVGGQPGTYIRLRVGGATINGSIEFTYNVKEYSTGNESAFASVVDQQMEGMLEKLALTFDRMYYTGGPTKGISNTRDTSTATSASATFGAGAYTKFGFLAMNWNGEWDFLARYSIVPGTPSTWARVDCLRLDNALPVSTEFAPGAPYGYWPTANYDGTAVDNGLIDLGNTATEAALFIAGYNMGSTSQTINGVTVPPKSVLIAIGADAAGATFTTEGTTGKETLPGFAFAFRIDQNNFMGYTQPVDGSGNTVASYFYMQPAGVLHNLCDDVQFIENGTRRSAATDPQPDSRNTRFQSWALTVSHTGVQARTDLTREVLTSTYDYTFASRGTQVDCWFAHPTQLSKYVGALVQPTSDTRTVVNQKWEGTPDPLSFKYRQKNTGESGFSFGGVNILVSQNTPYGLWFGMKKDTWHVITTASGGEWLAGTVGNMLSLVIGPNGRPTTKYIGTWLEIYNCYCIDPASNVLLCGMTI